MTKETLNSYIGQRVKVTFYDNYTVEGDLGFTPEFSAKYGYRKPNYYTIGSHDFKVSHIKRIERT